MFETNQMNLILAYFLGFISAVIGLVLQNSHGAKVNLKEGKRNAFWFLGAVIVISSSLSSYFICSSYRHPP
jgi:hypothetical protein